MKSYDNFLCVIFHAIKAGFSGFISQIVVKSRQEKKMRIKSKSMLFLLFFFVVNISYGYLCSQIGSSFPCLLNCCKSSLQTSHIDCCCYEQGKTSSFIAEPSQDTGKIHIPVISYAGPLAANLATREMVRICRAEENIINSPPLCILEQSFQI